MKASVWTVLSLVIIVMFAACSKDSNSGPGQGKAALTIKMTDAPGVYDSVNINIQSVQVISASSATMNLDTYSGMYNLLDLSNGKDTIIATGAPDQGVISQIRLILGDGNNVVVDGEKYALATPSAEESGLKLQLHDSLVAGVQYALLLDFDANQSIVKQGNGNYLLKPVIKVIDSAISGSIKGVVVPATRNVTVTATSGDNTYTSVTDANGHFLLNGVVEGNYTVSILADSNSDPIVINNVEVTTGVSTDLHDINL